MTPRHRIENDLLFVNKPSGLTTHASSATHPGFQEFLQKALGRTQIFPVHRLDQLTTGAMAFALTKEAAARTFELFKNHQVDKRYIFVTRSTSLKGEFHVQNHIEWAGQKMQISEKAANSETLFRRLKRNAFFELWEAFPKSGKRHQIRVHAACLGLPILGDSLYGGAHFSHLCLHSASLHIPGTSVWSAMPPVFMDRMGLLRDSTLCSWLAGLDRRQRLFDFLNHPEESLRLLHFEDPEFGMDQVGGVFWLQCYRSLGPKDQERFQLLSDLCRTPLHVQEMIERGQSRENQQRSRSFGEVPTRWITREGDLQFAIHKDRGLSSGLFLDQRNNRSWVSQNAHGLRVLNLFAYTCGFSVAAARGGAQSVTSVDLSSKHLEWGKENFALNSLPLERHSFFARDAIQFLQTAASKGLQFDGIVCDPPSFGRSKEGVFRLDKDLPKLLQAVTKCWSGRGWILLSTNFEKWTEEQVLHKLRGAFPNARIEPTEKPWDFELPGTEPRLKSFLVRATSSR